MAPAPVAPVIQTPASLINTQTVVVSGTNSADSGSIDITGTDVTVGNVLISGTTWTATATVPSDGTYQISVIAQDAAGNLSNVVDQTFEVVDHF